MIIAKKIRGVIFFSFLSAIISENVAVDLVNFAFVFFIPFGY